MKIILTLLMCSYTAGTCMPAYQWPDIFESAYDCSIFGYEESARKLREIGREEVDKYRMSITFTCTLFSEAET